MLFRTFNSGSNGNASVLKIHDDVLLIEAGISRKRIVEGLQRLAISPKNLHFILISHEHSDHVKGLAVLWQHIKFQVVATAGTIEGIRNSSRRDARYGEVADAAIEITPETPLVLNNFHITAYPTEHDTAESVGFVIEHQPSRIKLSYFTDTASISHAARLQMKSADIILLESNYDCNLLKRSNRPRWLKARIRESHLSNLDALAILRDVITPKTQAVSLAHLSGECNNPALVHRNLKGFANDMRRTKNWHGICMVATRNGPGPIYSIKSNLSEDGETLNR